MKNQLMAAALMAALGLSASAYADDVLDTMASDGGFKTMLTAIKTAGMEDTFKAAGPITVFAPNDEAFAKMPKKKFTALMGDKAALKKLISHHVVNTKITKAEVDAGKVATLDGSEVKLSVTDGVKIDNVPVAGEGMHADNGVVHTMTAVLMPK
jgi:uncharacterized surface protein with fasciclin (FAS1) repeats